MLNAPFIVSVECILNRHLGSGQGRSSYRGLQPSVANFIALLLLLLLLFQLQHLMKVSVKAAKKE